jgi:hypothetical protein
MIMAKSFSHSSTFKKSDIIGSTQFWYLSKDSFADAVIINTATIYFLSCIWTLYFSSSFPLSSFLLHFLSVLCIVFTYVTKAW